MVYGFEGKEVIMVDLENPDSQLAVVVAGSIIFPIAMELLKVMEENSLVGQQV